MSSRSLLTFLDAPVVVGDPDGRAAYVNPAFESRFSVSAQAAIGKPLAALFEGGMREAVLRAVAQVCEKGTSARFRVRQAGVGYAGLASPIVAEDARVGFVILLLQTGAREERLHALRREVDEPVAEITEVLDELLEQTGGRRSEKYRTLVEDGLRALTRVRKWSEELSALAAGKPVGEPAPPGLDPGRVVGRATGRLAGEFAAAGVGLEVHVPPRLPRVRGDGARLERALVQLLRQRLVRCGTASSVSVAVRAVERDGVASVVVTVVDAHAGPGRPGHPSEAEPEGLRQIVRDLGGELCTTADPINGRTTAIRLAALKQ